MVFRFEQLEIWKLAIAYANKIYDISDNLPKIETFGLNSQLKRSALSISNNIAEGSGAITIKEFCNFLNIAIKSTLETVSALYFAENRKYIESEVRIDLYKEAEIIIKKIRAFKNSLRNCSNKIIHFNHSQFANQQFAKERR